MTSRPLRSTTHCTARTQFRMGMGPDMYACTVLVLEPTAIVVTICDPGELVCESRRITNPDVIAFIRWRLETVAELSRRGGA